MKILIKNTLAYLGETLEPRQCSILIDEEGLMDILDHQKLETMDQSQYHLIDAGALVAVPAFTDLHVHFREPGFETKETLITGQKAAIRGGVTTVCTMPNTRPPIDRPSRLTDYQERIEKTAVIDLLPSVAITLNQAGEVMTELADMTKQGAKAYTDDGRTVMSKDILKEALKVSRVSGCPVMTHSEDHEQASHYPDRPYPPEVESDIVFRDVAILEETGGKLHIAHLSTEGSLEAVILGKEKNLNLSCEVSPHHLYFSSEALDYTTAKYKVNPPLRGEANRLKLIEGLKEGHIDAIASDHAPHEEETKTTTYQKGSYGFIGLETMFSSVYTSTLEHGVTLEQILRAMSLKPREILGLPKNTLEAGHKADLVLIHLEKQWQVTKEQFQSKSKNSPWIGETLKGSIEYVIRGNQLLLEKGEVKWPLND